MQQNADMIKSTVDPRGTREGSGSSPGGAGSSSLQFISHYPKKSAARTRKSSLQFASTDLRADFDLVMMAVGVNGAAIRYASDELKGDKRVVLAALKVCASP